MGGEAFNAYFGPTNPQLASHMYTLGVYEQQGTITPTLSQYLEYSNGTSAAGYPARANWNASKFVSDFTLGSVKAASWMRITYDSYTPYRIVTTGISALVGGDNCWKLPEVVQTAAVAQHANQVLPNLDTLSGAMVATYTADAGTYDSCTFSFSQNASTKQVDPTIPSTPSQY